MIEGAKQGQEYVAGLTPPGKGEEGAAWVSGAQHLTVLVGDGRHLLKVVSFNVDVGEQLSFAH